MDVIITYETLFDLLRKEKSRQELQDLPKDFYGRVVAYVRQKKADVESAGGFHAPTAQKSLIQYRNVQKLLREIYERRERKILEMALNRARTESNLIDTAALLPEEKAFFEDAALLLKTTKYGLLDLVLQGDAPAGMYVPVITEMPEGGYREEGHPEVHDEHALPEDVSLKESCAVKFIAPVPKFLGLKGEIHGPFEPGETAELPGKIAAVLMRKKRVEIVKCSESI